MEGHEFDTPEQELVHFLGKMYDGNFQWQRQYEETKKDYQDEGALHGLANSFCHCFMISSYL